MQPSEPDAGKPSNGFYARLLALEHISRLRSFADRSADIQALVNLGDLALGLLIKAFTENDNMVGPGVAEALVAFGGERVVSTLIEGLRSSNRYIRCWSAEALGNLGEESAVLPLVETLQSHSRDIRDKVVAALVNLGGLAVQPLIDGLNLHDSVVRSGMIEALGKLGDRRAVLPLIEALKESDPNVRASAAKALGLLGDERAVLPLIEALNVREKDVRSSAAEALGDIGDKRALLPLLEAFQDSDKDVRLQVACALGNLGNGRAVSLLVEALEDSMQTRSVAKALGNLRDESTILLLIQAFKRHYREGNTEVAEALARFGEPAFRPLILALNDSNENVRYGAAKALGKLGDTRAILPLVQALHEHRAYFHLFGAEALEMFGEAAVLPLIDALQDRDSEVRGSIARALGQIGDVRALSPLIQAFKECGDTARHQIAWALGKLGEPAFLPLMEALQDRDPEIRAGAAAALGELGDRQAVLPLIEALKDDAVRAATASALGKLQDTRTVPALIQAMQGSEDNIRSLAARSIPRKERLGSDHDNSQGRSQTASALGKLDDARAILPLTEALKDRDENVRKYAIFALEQLGNNDTLPLRVIVAENLAPAQKLDTLLALQRVNLSVFGGHWKLGNWQLYYAIRSIRAYCETLLANDNLESAIRQGVEAILNEDRRRLASRVLLRPGERDEDTEPKELLRSASNAPDANPPDELMRGAERPQTEHALKKRNLFGRFFR